MCFLNCKSIKILTNKKRSMKFQVFNEIINNVLDDKINKLKFRNEKFVELKC